MRRSASRWDLKTRWIARLISNEIGSVNLLLKIYTENKRSRGENWSALTRRRVSENQRWIKYACVVMYSTYSRLDSSQWRIKNLTQFSGNHLVTLSFTDEFSFNFSIFVAQSLWIYWNFTNKFTTVFICFCKFAFLQLLF